MVITTTGAKENQSTKELLCWNAEIHIGVFMCRVKVLGWGNSPNKGPRGEGLGEFNARFCECSHMWASTHIV
jgi:hypothetical protein